MAAGKATVLLSGKSIERAVADYVSVLNSLLREPYFRMQILCSKPPRRSFRKLRQPVSEEIAGKTNGRVSTHIVLPGDSICIPDCCMHCDMRGGFRHGTVCTKREVQKDIAAGYTNMKDDLG